MAFRDKRSFAVDMMLNLSDNEDFLSSHTFEDEYLNNKQSNSHTLRSSLPMSKEINNKPIEIPNHRILTSFYLNREKHIKLENVEIFIVRAIKKIFRNIVFFNARTQPNLAVHSSFMSKEEKKIWLEFVEIYSQDPKYFEDIVYGRIMPIDIDSLNIKKCKNHCKTSGQVFLSNLFMQTAFYKLIEYFFADFSCKKCCLNFRFRCCSNGKNSSHSDSCIVKWNELKLYFFKYYLDDIKVKNKISLTYNEDLDLIDPS